MHYLDEIDPHSPDFGDLYDELPLWSSHFGVMLLEQITMRPGMTILDLGAGTGFLSLELAQRCGADSRVIAVDPWAAAVTRLARKLRYLQLSNVRLIVSDAATLDLPDASVDLIVSNLGINNFENREAVLATCQRVARPGAELALTTNLVGHMAEFYEVFRSTLQELGLNDALLALDNHINHRATVDGVRSLLNSQGFEVLEVVTSQFQERFIDGSALLRHHFMRLGFVPAWKALVPPESVGIVFPRLEARLNEVAAEAGGLSLTIPIACVRAQKPHSSPA